MNNNQHITMPTRYEIQCPNCGGALVIPASNKKELQEFWKNCMDNKDSFCCPACQYVFQGLLEKCNFPAEDDWGKVVDVDGSRFKDAQKRLDRLFAASNEPQYLC